jgi:N-methylhydantoinase A
MHYRGQSHSLPVRVPDGVIDRALIEDLEQFFGAEHERTYGHRAGRDEPVQLVAIEVIGEGVRDRAGANARAPSSRAEPPPCPPRKAYFGPRLGWLDTPILRRSDLSAAPREGPLVIEEYDNTCVIPPGASALLDAGGNVVNDLPAGA